MSRNKAVDGAGVAAAGAGIVLIFIALFVVIFLIGTAITSLFVWLIWNVLGLHSVFGLEELSFWGVVAVAAALNFVHGLLRPPTVTVKE